MNSVQTDGGAVATLRAWKELTDAVRSAPENEGKQRGLNVWFHDLTAAVGKGGFSFTKKDGSDLEGASLTRFLNGARKDLALNFVKGGMPSDEADERCSIGGPNFLKIEVLVSMDTAGF